MVLIVIYLIHIKVKGGETMEEVTLTTLYQMILELQKQMAQSQSQIIQILRAEIKASAEETKRELRQEMQEMKEELRQEMQEMKEGLRQEMKEMKEELRQEMKEMKEELRTEMKRMKEEILSEVGETIIDTMQTIGKSQEKLFQNHEKRIVRLEDLNGISHEVLKVHEEEEPPYDAN